MNISIDFFVSPSKGIIYLTLRRHADELGQSILSGSRRRMEHIKNLSVLFLSNRKKPVKSILFSP